MQSTQWSGPLPPPADIEAFDRIVDNGPERVFAIMENAEQAASIREASRGQYLGTAISIVAIVGAILAVFLGAHWAVSVALVGVPLASVVHAIVYGRSTVTSPPKSKKSS